MRHYDAVAGSRRPAARCHLSAVVYRLSAGRCVCLGAAMRFCPGSCINRLMWVPGQKSLSWFAKTGVFRVPGQFPLPRFARQSFYVRTGTVCRFRDWLYSADSVCRVMWTLGIVLSWFSYMARNCVPGRRFLPRCIRQSIDACTGANSRPGTIGRGPVAGVERDVVMIAPGSPTRKAGRNHAVWLQHPHITHITVYSGV